MPKTEPKPLFCYGTVVDFDEKSSFYVIQLRLHDIDALINVLLNKNYLQSLTKDVESAQFEIDLNIANKTTYRGNKKHKLTCFSVKSINFMSKKKHFAYIKEVEEGLFDPPKFVYNHKSALKETIKNHLKLKPSFNTFGTYKI